MVIIVSFRTVTCKKLKVEYNIVFTLTSVLVRNSFSCYARGNSFSCYTKDNRSLFVSHRKRRPCRRQHLAVAHGCSSSCYHTAIPGRESQAPSFFKHDGKLAHITSNNNPLARLQSHGRTNLPRRLGKTVFHQVTLLFYY